MELTIHTRCIIDAPSDSYSSGFCLLHSILMPSASGWQKITPKAVNPLKATGHCNNNKFPSEATRRRRNRSAPPRYTDISGVVWVSPSLLWTLGFQLSSRPSAALVCAHQTTGLLSADGGEREETLTETHFNLAGKHKSSIVLTGCRVSRVQWSA